MSYLYRIFKVGDRFKIVREDGRAPTYRHRVSYAEEVAEALEAGRKPPKEREQILRHWAALDLVHDENGRYPWKIVDRHGVTVRSFKYEYVARWWYEDYQLRRKLAKGPQHESLRDGTSA